MSCSWGTKEGDDTFLVKTYSKRKSDTLDDFVVDFFEKLRARFTVYDPDGDETVYYAVCNRTNYKQHFSWGFNLVLTEDSKGQVEPYKFPHRVKQLTKLNRWGIAIETAILVS
ncbi:MAG: hypothetical protein KJ718_04795 [Nanoarchaeota archaeon]|nr:hypothetical protein [Nanoarchaeota archaeon]MBU1051845.1 hypothetical protein [Nanoarchaeota archaeon]MBU1988214.1 hypothetical protein [Nanoarchaeota archaeon]